MKAIPGVKSKGIHVIAKIESQQGLDNFDDILEESDGIMVARGDLGVEIPLERVCSAQKRMIKQCNLKGKFVITATEMLDSMISNPRPTRAEASDVANAVFDGTDCVMLSGETAVGAYPIEALQVMHRICKEAEIDVKEHGSSIQVSPSTHKMRDAFAASAVETAKRTGIKLVVVITQGGRTAETVAKHQASTPILVLSKSPKVCAQVSLYRSVTPLLIETLEREVCVPSALDQAAQMGLVSEGDRVLLLTGHDDKTLTRMETFVAGERLPKVRKIPGQRYSPGSSVIMP